MKGSTVMNRLNVNRFNIIMYYSSGHVNGLNTIHLLLPLTPWMQQLHVRPKPTLLTALKLKAIFLLLRQPY